MVSQAQGGNEAQAAPGKQRGEEIFSLRQHVSASASQNFDERSIALSLVR